MSEQPSSSGETKTVAIRVTPEFKQQLDSVVALAGKKLNEAGVEALTDWVGKVLADPAVRERAVASLEQEQRALDARRAALGNLVGDNNTDATGKPRKRGSSS